MHQKEKYLEIQQKIRELCLSYGLIELHRGPEIQFRTEEDESLIFGEVIRLFVFDLVPKPIVVFFNELNYVGPAFYHDYLYIYEFNPEKIPFKLKDKNLICLDEDLDYILNVIEYVVVGAIKQRKELLLKLKQDSINKDFDM